MLTVTVVDRIGDAELPLPLANVFKHRATESTGGSLLNDTRMNAQTVIGAELYQPLVYAYWTYREVMRYSLTDRSLVENPSTEREVQLLNVLLPLYAQNPILILGNPVRVRDALQATKETFNASGVSFDWRTPNYDLSAISTDLHSDQWMRGFAREGNVNKGKVYGNAIELDQIFKLIATDSATNEVGVTLQVPGAALMVRILHGGRVQFYNFSSSNLWERSHDTFGDPIPLIYQTLAFLRRYAA